MVFKATKAIHKIQQIKGNEIIFKCTAQNWVKYFKSGDLFLEIKAING